MLNKFSQEDYMENQVIENQAAINVPSVYHLKCPQCGADSFRILGKKGALGKSIGVGVAFGAIGNLVANASSKDDYAYEPIQYKCIVCQKKFEALPLLAQPDEILSVPCKIIFKRLSSFVGMAVSQSVWLNGIKIGSIKNGKAIEFPTYVRYNTLFVSDQYGVAFKTDYKFEAQPGGCVEVQFKRKFK